MSQLAPRKRTAPRNHGSYTVLSAGSPAGHDSAAEEELSALVFGRGGTMYWDRLFESLYSAGIARITYVGSDADRGRGARMSSLFPGVRVLLPSGAAGPGSLVNLGMREIGSGKVIVLGSDQRLAAPILSARMKKKISVSDALYLCPSLEDKSGSPAPLAFVPDSAFQAWTGLGVRTPPVFLPLPGTARNGRAAESEALFFPGDYCGVYDVARFLLCGGFDETLKDPWWQLVDFGAKAWAAGAPLRCLPSLVLRADEDKGSGLPAEDVSASWAAFWLKWLGRRNPGTLLAYLAARGGGIAEGFLEYRRIRLDRRATGTRTFGEALSGFEAARGSGT